MYRIIKSVIQFGSFELNDILTKIDTVWMQGGISDSQRQELVQQARGKADPANSFAPLQAQIDALAERVAKLEAEKGEASDEGWPEYVQPTGAHDAYRAGDKVTYNGNRYICIAPEGVAVVWSPDTYPDYWREATK